MSDAYVNKCLKDSEIGFCKKKRKKIHLFSLLFISKFPFKVCIFSKLYFKKFLVQTNAFFSKNTFLEALNK